MEPSRSSIGGGRAKKPSKTTRARPRQKRQADGLVPVTAIGASAGGFGPLQAFFRALPVDSGSAFVVIQHFDPRYRSIANELFGKCTSLPVVEAQDGMRLERDHVYTVPSNRKPILRDGRIRLEPPANGLAIRAPIDDFFRSLALERREEAIGIVLSGGGSDGAEGARAIHAAGGIVIVQDPKTAQFDSMPRSALMAGETELVLPVEKMPDAVRGYVRHRRVQRVAEPPATTSAALDAIFSLLRARLGLCLTDHKRGALVRRIHHRMDLREIKRTADYAALLGADTAELEALGRDLQSGVSEFFIDPPAWEALERDVIGPLVARKQAGVPIRAWVVGTATGEEAYSLAIVLFEKLDAANKPCPVRVFATDVDADALEVARRGIYPAGIASRVEPTRLRRFFEEVDKRRGYRVSLRVRTAVTFAQQDIWHDRFFSNLELVCCRGMLIDLEPESYEKVLSTFAFALRPDCYLFLGGGESKVDPGGFFAPVSEKWGIYRRTAPRTPGETPGEIVTRLAERAILDRVAPASVLVNRRGEVLYFCGPVERYLAPPRGAPRRDLVTMVRRELRVRLRVALQQASRRVRPITVENVRFRIGRALASVRIRIHQLKEGGSDGFLLVTFEESEPASARRERRRARSSRDSRVHELEKELDLIHDELESAIDQLDQSKEEYSASHEEVVSINEELNATNEELQASHDELWNVNSQLQRKVGELEEANADLRNLLSSTNLATVCLDRQLRIRWFSPDPPLNLIPSDVGRAVSDIASTLFEDDLAGDANQVLDKLGKVEKEVRTHDGRWYVRCTQPYRSLDERIEGLVVTFTDIDRRKRVETDLKELNAELERRIEDRTRHLKVLREAALITNEASSPVEGLTRSIECVCRELGWPLGHAWVLESENGVTLVDSGVWWPPSAATDVAPFVEASRTMEIKAGVGFIGTVVTTRSPHWIPDVAVTSKLQRPVQSLAALGIRGALAIPILIGKSVVGALEFFTPKTIEPERVLFEGLAELGAQLGRVIERVQAAETVSHISSELFLVEERERQQLAADLHDDVGQLLPLATIRLDALTGGAPAELAEPLAELRRVLDRALEATRSVTFQLSPPPLRDLGLVPAIQWLAETTADLHGLQVIVEGEGEFQLPESVRLLVFRCVRELLVNVTRHARATKARVRFARADHALSISVADDGVGFTPLTSGVPSRSGRFGLFSVRERLSYLGGRLEIRSAPGKGATVTLSVPLETKGTE